MLAEYTTAVEERLPFLFNDFKAETNFEPWQRIWDEREELRSPGASGQLLEF